MDGVFVRTPDVIRSSQKVNSLHDYLSYSKKMQMRLAEINNNVSCVIQESCTGIDNICNRVRQCLNEMDQREYNPPPGLGQCDKLKDAEEEYISEDILSNSGDISQSLGENTFAQSGEESGDITESEDTLKTGDMGSSDEILQSTSNCFHMEEKYDEEIPIDKEPSTRKEILNKTVYCLKNPVDSASVLQEIESVGEIHYINFNKTVNTLCDNFEMMNHLIETINNEIREFSETAIPKSEDKNIKKIVKPTKAKVNSGIQIDNIQGDYWSDTEEIDMMDLVCKDSIPFPIPDVYRKRAFTNLYERLRAQVEASDSLMFFKTLIQRQKKLVKNKISLSQCKLNIPFLNYSLNAKSEIPSQASESARPQNKQNLKEKYAGSLWFSPKQTLNDKSSKPTFKKIPKKQCKRKNAASTTIMKTNSNQSKKPLPKSNSTKSCVQTQIEPSKFKSMEEVSNTCSLECTCKMLIKNEGPAPSWGNKCQLQWLKSKPATQKRRLKFIDMLDDLTNKDLLPLQSEYPRKDNERGRELDYKNVKETYLYKLMYGVQGTRNAWHHLFEPTNVAKHSRLSRGRPGLCRSRGNSKEEKRFQEKICDQNGSKTEILKKLSPYIYNHAATKANFSKTVIVMPVQVYYESFKSSEPPTRLISSIKPPFGTSKKGLEDKAFKSTSYFNKPPKSMRVVFDGIQNKTEFQPNAGTKQSPVLSSARYCVEKPTTKRVASKSLSPKNFMSYCPDMKNCKKGPINIRYEQNIDIYNKIQSDIETIKDEIYGKKCNKVDRKLWEHKYGKSVGQKLVNFVGNQKPEECYVPRYAMPKLQNQTNLKTTDDESCPSRQPGVQKELLHFNNQIMPNTEGVHTNIKKAIEVIEGRMVDILSNNSDSVQAFDIMEKEITEILNLMKCKGQAYDPKENKEKGSKDALEEKYEVISENLFERLERILTEESSNPSTAEKEEVENPKKEVQKKKKVSRHVEEPQKERALKKEPKKDNEVKKKHTVCSSKRIKTNLLPSTGTSSEGKKEDKKRSSRGSKKEAKANLECTDKPPIVQSPDENLLLKELHQVMNDEKAMAVQDSKIFQDKMGMSSTFMVENTTSENKAEKLQKFEESNAVFACSESSNKNDIAISRDRIDASNTFIIKNATSEDKVEKLEKNEESDAMFAGIESYNKTDKVISQDRMNSSSTFIIDKVINEDKVEKLEKCEAFDAIFACLKKYNEYDTATSQEKTDASSASMPQTATSNEKIEKLVKAERSDAIFACLENYDEYKSMILSKIDAIINKELDVKAKDLIVDERHINTESKLQTVQNDEPEEVLINNLNAIADSLNIVGDNSDQNKNDTPSVQDEKGENYTEMAIERDSIKSHDNETCLVEKEEFTHAESGDVLEQIVECEEEETDNEKAQPIQEFGEEETEDMSNANDNSSINTSDVEYTPQRLDEDSYTVHMHKIIKRVENIYSQLDDIQDCESLKHIPVFKEVTLPEVPSEDFLTPFMHVVKETREISKANNDLPLEKSPSYYNIMNFLDAMSSIQQEVAHEVHTVRMSNNALNLCEATVYAQAERWEEAKYSTSNYKTSCLKKSFEDTRQNKQHKKVSFFDLKRDQSSQATLCPYHKIKVVKISSQQFPPVKTDKETTGEPLQKDHQMSLTQTDTIPDVSKTDQGDTALSCQNNPKENKSTTELNTPNCLGIYCCHQNGVKANKGDYGSDGERNPTTDNRQTKPCEVQVKWPCTSQCVGGPEKKIEPELSFLGDKSTQVFCQMQNQSDNSSEEKLCPASEEEPVDHPKRKQDNPDDSKSIEQDSYDDSQIDPLFDYTKERVTSSSVMQKIDEIYDEKNSKLGSSGQTPNIAVFREITDVSNILPQKSTIDRIEMYKLEKRRRTRLLRRQNVEMAKKQAVSEDNENVVLLKSFYAIVYILVFTALSLDYRCL